MVQGGENVLAPIADVVFIGTQLFETPVANNNYIFPAPLFRICCAHHLLESLSPDSNTNQKFLDARNKATVLGDASSCADTFSQFIV